MNSGENHYQEGIIDSDRNLIYKKRHDVQNSDNIVGDDDETNFNSSTQNARFINATETEEDLNHNSTLTAFDDAKPSSLVVVLTFLASISGFMFGYDTGYISSAIVTIGNDLGKELTYGEKEIMTSATSLGALISSTIAGIIADLIGRRKVIMGSNLLFILGALLQCGAHSLTAMISGRFIMGLGVGIGSLIAPLYISELAPTNYRGRLVVINCLAITGGQLIAYAVGAGISRVKSGWRILVGISLFPSVVQLIMFLFMPDTPRFLIMKNRLEEASSILQRIYKSSDPSLIGSKVYELSLLNSEIPGNSALTRTKNGFKEIFQVPSNLRALIIGCGLQFFQQFTGWNALMYFSATIFETIGFNNPTVVSILVAGTNFIFTIVAFFVIDTIGRRSVLMIGLPCMMMALLLCAISFQFLGIKFEDSSVAVSTYHSQEGDFSIWNVVVIISMIIFAAGYAIGIGNVPWQQSELFPQSVRGIGASCATTTNWIGSLTISATFLTMLQKITPSGTFLLFAIITFIAIFFVYFCYPELTGLELEEVQNVLTGGFNIEKSIEMSRHHRTNTGTQHHFVDYDGDEAGILINSVSDYTSNPKLPSNVIS
ncbi:hypothetical protein PACTADRAFT_35990 [Pachysolen tannophilus NRRL Y-2460]|uniref:Major facilitator superfamily (MFS) profile domain-containing protein n=1 Tax=Pachysolen tannophilus NRRL Y-2460 TaxID=669874 RepID=A0A1E4TNM4_PACTA|nr:hypothetical protein PACTADRAFT_35990 [Pachysolen tannophilus NRRL Y-2460]